jgi:hypothetical protein
MYACTHETGGGFVAGGVRLGVSRHRSRCFVAKLGLQYGCCNIGWNEFCHTYVFLQIATKSRADERTRTAYPCSSYEFACVGSSPYWCVRKLAYLGAFRLSRGVALSIEYQCV